MRRKKHKPSILHSKDGTCYLCEKLNRDFRRHQVLHEHHIFGGPDRSISEEEGLKVYLCLAHHIDGPEAVHNNHKNMRLLQKDGQRAYECTHTREAFMDRFGRNYLGDEPKPEKPPESAEPGIIFLDECHGCFGAAGNDCARCREERHGKSNGNI